MAGPAVRESGVGAPSRSLSDEAVRLARLAWPVVLANIGAMLLGVVDVVMVGQLGETALAGTSLGHTASFSLQLLLLGAAAGLDPVFAQAFGARDSAAAGASLARASALLLALSLPLGLLHLLAGPALAWADQPPDAVAIAHDYTVIRALGVLPFAALVLLRHLLQADGRMWPGFWAILAGNIVNVGVNGCLLYGWLGAPVLGPVGAAWASVASTALMAGVLVVPAWGRIAELRPRPAALRDVPAMRRMLAVCLPVAFQVGLEGWGFSVTTVLSGWLGETALAAHTVVLTLTSVAFMVPLGLGSAASARVGNLLGAGHPWGRAAGMAVGLGAVFMGLVGLLWVSAPAPLASAFVDAPAVVALAAAVLPVAGAFALFDGVQVVAFGVLRGAGDTGVPALANIVGYYLVGLPIGAALAFGAGLGLPGLWVGLLVALASVAGLLLIRLRGTWRRGGYRVGR